MTISNKKSKSSSVKINVYLACPYTHKTEEVMLRRYEQVTAKAAELMIAGYCVFSPISHSHPIARAMPAGYIKDFGFWMYQDLDYIKRGADELWVFALDGWSISKGVLHEITTALEAGVSVKILQGYT